MVPIACTMTNTTQIVTAENTADGVKLTFASVGAELFATRSLLFTAKQMLTAKQQKKIVRDLTDTVRTWTNQPASDARALWLPSHEANLALAMQIFGRE